jgi:hypothetical protein
MLSVWWSFLSISALICVGIWPVVDTVKEAPGKKAGGLLPQVHFVPRIVLGHDFVPPVINIYVQFVRQVYFCCMPDRICRTQFGQCTLNLDMVFCLAFVLFQISSIIRARQLGFDCSVLRKFWERAGSWHFFTCFSELKQPSLDHCFLCCVCV